MPIHMTIERLSMYIETMDLEKWQDAITFYAVRKYGKMSYKIGH